MATGAISIARRSDDAIEVVAVGQWTAENATAIDVSISDVVASVTGSQRISLQMSGVTRCDSYGAWLMERLKREASARGCRVEVVGLPARFAGLVDTVSRVPDPPVKDGPQQGFWARLARGRKSAEVARRDGAMLLSLLGEVGNALVTTIVHPQRFRLTSMIYQVDRVAWQAVPIIVLITFLIGGIIAQQGFFHFRKFGADLYVVDMVGILILREIGVLLVAIMVAGRSGSSYTAELGSMKMREEIDALRTMGLDPITVLILPRILALVLALPALTILGSLAALYGGGVIATLYGDMSPSIFVDRLRDAITLTHAKVGIIKAPFMAVVIGLVACSEGLKVKGSAESLGLHTTASVVKSIFLVIVLDGVFAIYFSAIGM